MSNTSEKNASGKVFANGVKAFASDSKKLRIAAIAAAVVLAAGTVLALSFSTRIAGRFYPVGTKRLVLSSTDITSARGIGRLTAPESIDLRDTTIPAEEILALTEKFPDCDIRWEIPIDGGVDSHAELLAPERFTEDQLPLLSGMKRLDTIDMRGHDPALAAAVREVRPDCTVLWDVSVGGERYDSGTVSLSAANASADELRGLVYLEQLSSVDASGCREYDALMEVSALMPDCEFLWTVPIGGMEVPSSAEEIDFQRRTVTDIAALDREFENLKYLPALKVVDMCGCGVPSEQMAKWRERYPDVKFVWEITFGSKTVNWTVRTDITVFSTLLGSVTKIGDQETFRELFLYCTDLVALDLGHNRVSDISMITNLKKLQGLILTDNPVSDFSPLTQLPELQFLELNMTKVSDVTPFKDCKALLHLDLYTTRVTDVTALQECKGLKYLILASNDIDFEQKVALKKALPDTKIAHTISGSDKYIRQSPVRSSFRLALKNYRLIEEFVSWDNVTYKEGAELVYPRGYLSSWPED